MNVMIDIECDTISELVSHLSKLIVQVNRQAVVSKQDPDKEDFPEGTQLSDDNCYGTHELNVIEYIKRKK